MTAGPGALPPTGWPALADLSPDVPAPTPAVLSAQAAALDGLRRVVGDPVRFALRLGLPATGTGSRARGRRMRHWWEVGAVGLTAVKIAKMGLAAAKVLRATWLLKILGLGAAATPVGWAVAAGLAAAGAYYGVSRVARLVHAHRARARPAFLGTPMDVLAAALFDLIAPLALRVARADEACSHDERREVLDHFVHHWGYDRAYAEAALAIVEANSDDRVLGELAKALAAVTMRTPECDHEAMTADVVRLLRDVAAADGHLSEREEAAIDRVEQVLRARGGLDLDTVRREVARRLPGLGLGRGAGP